MFAGPREDPFFFNLAGFKATAASVAAEKGTMTRNLGGCPQINAATSASLVNELKTAPGGGPPQDAFAGKNVLSIAIVLDKTLVTQGGPIVTTWGATLK